MLNEYKQMDIHEYEQKAFHFESGYFDKISFSINPYDLIETQIAYSIIEDQVIASVFKEKTDKTFFAVISNYSSLTNLYQCTWLSEEHNVIDGAINQLNSEISRRKELYEASLGKPSKYDKMNPFIFRSVKKKNYSPYITYIKDDPTWQAARMTILEALEDFVDADGNFIEQLQTTAFDQRLWELYLNSYFCEEGFSIDKTKAVPDFLITKGTEKVGIEAVTIANKNPSINPNQNIAEKMTKELRDEIFLGYSSALTGKLNKQSSDKNYWEFEYLAGCPLVFAVENFRDNFALMNGTSVLSDYLYGLEVNPSTTTFENIKGQNVIKSNGSPVETGFFYQEGAENISAILTTAQGSLPKFNRIGIYKGYAPASVFGYQMVNEYNRKPNARTPKHEVRRIYPGGGQEYWAEGIAIYHNPNAKIKLPFDLFPNASHTMRDGNYLYSIIPSNFSFKSFTSFFGAR